MGEHQNQLRRKETLALPRLLASKHSPRAYGKTRQHNHCPGQTTQSLPSSRRGLGTATPGLPRSPGRTGGKFSVTSTHPADRVARPTRAERLGDLLAHPHHTYRLRAVGDPSVVAGGEPTRPGTPEVARPRRRHENG